MAPSRGAITELNGKASSGRTAMLHSWIAAATVAGEVAAIVDFDNAFDPYSARAAGADLGKLLWIRAGRQIDHAFRSTDILLHGGGFGLIVLDLCDVPQTQLQRVPLSYWHRFRKTVENTPSMLVVAALEPQAKSCARRQIEVSARRIEWSGNPPFQLLESLNLEVSLRKPVTGERRKALAMAA
jgi:hypothetical protein